MLDDGALHTDMVSDHQLCQLVTAIRQRMPNFGEALLVGRLGYHVTRHRV